MPSSAVMNLLRSTSAALAARGDTSPSTSPEDFCSPECPACKTQVIEFDNVTSCAPNSTFILDCGSCQSCIIAFAVENGTSPDDSINLTGVLELCLNTTSSAEIEDLEAQASRINELASSASTSTTIVSAPSTSTTGTYTWDTTSWSTNATGIATSPPISAPRTSTTPSSRTSYIVGPIIGLILAIAIGILIIFFIQRRRRKQKDFAEMMQKPESDGSESCRTESRQEEEKVAQLHSDCIPNAELENTAIYELPAVEPVGTELNTPSEQLAADIEWPIPISPLPLLFKMTLMRDERIGADEPPKHETYYNP